MNNFTYRLLLPLLSFLFFFLQKEISFATSNCSTTITLSDGVTYSGNTSDGATDFSNYSCTSIQHQGKETGHFFISSKSGDATVLFNNTSGAEINLFMASACNPDSCLQFWQGPSVNTTVYIEAGVPYYFITDVVDANSDGDYQLTITLSSEITCICTDVNSEDICENFESFSLGAISPQSQCWMTASGNPLEDGSINNLKAASGQNSLAINDENNNVVMNLGDKSSGKYILRFKILPEFMSNAYWRVWHTYEPGNPDNELAFDVRMEVISVGLPFGKLYAGDTGSSATFPYFSDGATWTEFIVEFDFDNDFATLYYLGDPLHSWAISNTSNGTGGIKNISALNFCAEGELSDYKIDDVRFYKIDENYCENSGALVCDDFDNYALGSLSTQSPLWSTPSGVSGAIDGSVTLENSISGKNSLIIRSGTPSIAWDNVFSTFGEVTSGRIKKSFKIYIPPARAALMRTVHELIIDTQKNEEYGSLIEFTTQGTGVLTTGGQTFLFNFPFDEWFDYEQLIDFDTDQTTVWINGTHVASYPFTNTITGTGGSAKWAGMNFYSADQGGPYANRDVHFYIDNVELFDLDLYLTVDPMVIPVPSEAGSVTVDVESNIPLWSTNTDAPWLTPSPATGANNGTVTINFDENFSIQTRNEKVKVSGPGVLPKYVEIIQEGADGFIEVSPNNIQNVPETGGRLNFTVSSNVSWNVQSSDTSWLKPINPASGINDGVFSADYTRNLGGLRQNTLFITGQPAAPIEVIVIQTASGPVLMVDSDTIRVPVGSGQETFEVISNVNWTITNNSGGWISSNPSAGSDSETIIIDYAENQTVNPKEAIITVTGDQGTGDHEIIVIQESTSPFLDLSTLAINLPNGPSGTTTFSIDANVDWDLIENASWFSLNPNTGTGDRTITLSYDENGSINMRSSNINVIGSNGVPQLQITINQAASPRKLEVDQEVFNVQPVAGFLEVNISSNINWFVSTTSTWLSLDPATTGSMDGILTINYTENTDMNPRTARVRLYGIGVPDVFIEINQNAIGSFLEADPNTLSLGSSMGSSPFIINSNVAFSISENVSWLTTDLSSGSGNILVNAIYSDNPNPTPRTAEIYITQTGGILRDTIFLTQEGQVPILEASVDTLRIPYTQGMSNLDVLSNVFWTLTDDASWLSPSMSNGFGNSNVQFNHTENDLVDPRQAIITISSLGVPDVLIFVIQEGAPASINADPLTLNVDASAGTVDFDVIANVDWEIQTFDPWVSVNLSQGTGNQTITVSFDENTSLSGRTSTIKIDAVGSAVGSTVTLIQQPAGAILNVNPLNINLTAPAGNSSFDISSNISWDVSTSANWITINSLSTGTDDATIDFDYTENTDSNPRTAIITISGNGVANQTVTVTQDVVTAFLGISTNTINVDAPAGSTTFDVNSNVNWTIVSTAPWFTLDQTNGTGNGTITIDYTENTATTIRTETILVQSPGLQDQIITINQAGTAAAFLTVTPSDDLNVSNVAGNQLFDVNANVPWTVTSSQPWLSVDPAAGNGVGMFTASWLANPDQSARTGTITVTGNGVPIITINVIQASFSPIIGANPTTFDVGPDAGTVSTNLTSNISWTVNSNASWVTANPSFGNGNGSINLDYDENPNSSPRTAMLTVSGGGAPDITIIINQSESTNTNELTAFYGLKVFPNPVCDQMFINFNLPETEYLELQIVSVTGQVMRHVTNDKFQAGSYNLRFPVGGLANGMYLLKFRTDHGIATERFMVSK